MKHLISLSQSYLYAKFNMWLQGRRIAEENILDQVIEKSTDEYIYEIFTESAKKDKQLLGGQRSQSMSVKSDVNLVISAF